MDYSRKTIKSQQEEANENEEKTSFKKELISWIEVILLALILSNFITKVILINAEVPTCSMENLIQPDDRLFGNRLAYKFSDPERFDVIIFKYPVDEEENYIKRIIGLPGETVEITDGKIYINGSATPLEENYLPEAWDYDNTGYYYEVPDDCYFVLGDNRNMSMDARFWADEALGYGLVDTYEEAMSYTFVKEEQILGKAVFTYWPKFSFLSDYVE